MPKQCVFMKRILGLWALIFLGMSVLSCDAGLNPPPKDPSETTSSEPVKIELVAIDPTEKAPSANPAKAAYTVMFYGAGGGNLDEFLNLNLQQALDASPYIGDKVQFTAQFNWSKQYQTNPEMSGTQRLYLEPHTSAFTTAAVYSGADMKRLYEPAVLADYITWTAENFPADKYMLVLWNHGSGWLPLAHHDGPQGRAIIFDDNFTDSSGNTLAQSITQLVQGIRDAAVDTIDLLYYDACNMNMLENLGELQASGKITYTLGAGHLTPGIGGDYTALIELLHGGSNTLDSMKEYCRRVMEHWKQVASDYPWDIIVTELSKMPAVFDALKNITYELPDMYASNRAVFDNIPLKERLGQEGVYFYNFEILLGNTKPQKALLPYADIYDYVSYVQKKTGSSRLQSYAGELRSAIDAAILHREVSSSVAITPTFSVTMLGKTYWDGVGYGTVYPKLRFHEKTGWGTWLQTNRCGVTITVDTQ